MVFERLLGPNQMRTLTLATLLWFGWESAGRVIAQKIGTDFTLSNLNIGPVSLEMIFGVLALLGLYWMWKKFI